MAINTRSPYFVSIEDENISYAELKIYVWEGDKNTPPSEEKYYLKKNTLSSVTKVSFEVSELIRDFIGVKFRFASILQDGIENQIEDGFSRLIITASDSGDSVVWVKLDLNAYDSNDTEIVGSTETNLALDSYSYFENSGFNLGESSILISNRNLVLLREDAYNLPIYVENNPTVTLYNGATVVKTESYIASDESNEQIEYFNIFDISDLTSIVVVDDNKTETIKLSVISECKQTPSKVTFLNKFGVLENMHFLKKYVETINVNKDSYKSNILTFGNSYDNTNHVNKDFNINANESISLSSGFLNEGYNETLRQLLLSEQVWNTKSGKTTPINVKTSSQVYKTSLNDKLVEYTINFDNSFDTINNIR